MGKGLLWWVCWEGGLVKNTKKTFIYTDAINWRYFPQLLRTSTTESEDIATEKRAQLKQPDNIKE